MASAGVVPGRGRLSRNSHPRPVGHTRPTRHAGHTATFSQVTGPTTDFSSTLHFTPTHASWMNLVEVWFSLIERQAIHRGVYGSVKDLNAKIRAYIDGWNDRCHPFTWTKTAEDILKHAKRNETSNAEH